MDKVSKVSKRKCLTAAIDYVQHLQRSVEALKEDISNMEAAAAREVDGSVVAADDVADDASSSACNPPPHPQEEEEEQEAHEGEARASAAGGAILQLEVSRLEKDVYSFQVLCKNEQQALERLVRAFETLNVDVVKASISTRNDKIHSYYVVEARDWSSLELEDVKSRFIERISQIR